MTEARMPTDHAATRGTEWPASRVHRWCGGVLAVMLLLAAASSAIYRPVMRDYHAVRDLMIGRVPGGASAAQAAAAAFLRRNRFLPQGVEVAGWLAASGVGRGTPAAQP